jgi:tRNA 2-selenouridine synthase
LTPIDHTRATVEQLAEFDTLIDARSPSEFAEDHIPGAINCPVLDDQQRITVGTLYKQVSAFDARKLGSVLVARNIATHIETLFADKPKGWKPLVYCWRGGQRSGAFTHILREVGWQAMRLTGGYKSWRGHVIAQLDIVPKPLRFTVVAGPTGSAKTRILEAMQLQGQQVLNLEALAAHKGSVLGDLPGLPQPSQKMFETLVLTALEQFDPARPVYVESESKRIGQLRVPDAVFQGIQDGNWLRVQASMAQRVQFLLRDYDYFLSGPELEQQLERLKESCGGETVTRWKGLAQAKDFSTLVAELLTQHYDRFYLRSMNKHAEGGAHSSFATDDLSDAGIALLAKEIAASTPIPLAS